MAPPQGGSADFKNMTRDDTTHVFVGGAGEMGREGSSGCVIGALVVRQWCVSFVI